MSDWAYENTAFEKLLADGGWRSWSIFHSSTDPRGHEAVELLRREWSAPYVFRMADVHPGMNIHGLYWRPAT